MKTELVVLYDHCDLCCDGAGLDVLHYSATLEPDIAGKSVKGTVRIRFATDSGSRV